nr:hypothetical protein [Tanacetum cinerariifolium]
MTLEEIKEKFDPVWKQIQDFIPIGSKEESERFKTKGIRLEQDSAKKVKTSEEVLKEKLKEMMELILVEENLMHALVEWKLYDTCGVHHVISKDQEMFMLVEKDYPLRKGLAIGMISYKIQVENYSQMANDLILKIYKIASSPRQQGIPTGSDKFPLPEQLPTANEDKFPLLIQSDATTEELCTAAELWVLVKETLNIRPATSDKEKELWVELKRLYEPDVEDLLWTHTQNMMHAPVEWKLYDKCGVHHVISKDQEMFMLVEKDYPLRKGLAIVMISYKLQVEN